MISTYVRILNVIMKYFRWNACIPPHSLTLLGAHTAQHTAAGHPRGGAGTVTRAGRGSGFRVLTLLSYVYTLEGHGQPLRQRKNHLGLCWSAPLSLGHRGCPVCARPATCPVPTARCTLPTIRCILYTEQLASCGSSACLLSLVHALCGQLQLAGSTLLPTHVPPCAGTCSPFITVHAVFVCSCGQSAWVSHKWAFSTW